MSTLQTKICGIRSAASAFAAATASANYIGFNFVTSSKRLIEANEAKTIVKALKEEYPNLNRPKTVGVFANQPLLYINSVAEYCDLDMVQLSGNEPFAFAERVTAPTLKAIKVETNTSRESELKRLDQLAKLAEKKDILIILDKYDPHLQGGTGQIHDWLLAAELAKHHLFLLSGGLNIENINEAILSIRPFGIDVASGIETDGQDNATKITAFLNAAQLTNEGINH
jgi:phosphoribosylanthranilate isomerase